LKFLLRVQPGNLPRLNDVHLDGYVLAFTLLVSLATGLIFGLVPALQATRTDLNESLKEEGRGMTAGRRRHRLRSGLVIAEIRVSLILLVDAGLMIRSFVRVNSQPPGYQTSHLLAVDIGLPGRSTGMCRNEQPSLTTCWNAPPTRRELSPSAQFRISL
jgi:hypothetical protein